MSYNARRNGGFNNQHFCQQVGNIGQRRPSIGRPPIANNFVLGGQLKVPSKPVVVNQQDATQQQTGAQNAQGQHQQANAMNFKNEGQTPQQQTITSPKVKLEQQIQEVQQPQHQEAAQLQQQQQTVQIQQDAQQQQQNEQLQQQQTEQLKEQAEQIQQQKQATQLQQEAAQLQVPQTIQIQHKTAQCQQQPAQLQQEAAQLQEQETTQIQQHQTTERQEQQAVQLQQQAVQLQQQAVQLQQQQAIQLQQQQAVQLQQQQATRPQHQQATRPQQQQATRTHQQQAAKLQQEAAKLKQEAVYLQQEAAQLQQMQVAQLRQQRAAQFQRQQAARFQQKQAAQFQQQQAAQLRQQKQQVVQFQQQQQSAQLQQQAAQLQLHIEQQLAKLADSAVCIKPDGKVLKKPFWSKGPGSSVASGKVSRRERVRRRNFKLSRMLHPKNAVMILNELVKNASYMLEELPSKFDDNQFKATVFYDGIEHTGYGRDKIHAKNTAAEAALKHLIKPSRLAEIKKDEDGNEEMDLIEGDPNQPPLPWQHVASFALYKLFSSWGEDSSTAQGESQNFATINNSDNRPSKKMPENPANINPLMLINQMLPQANFEEIGKTGNPPTVTFSFRCNVDGQSFIGTGPNKKAAKRMAAFGACSKILGITYPPEIYVPIY